MLAICLGMISGEENKRLFTAFYSRYEKRLYAVALDILKRPALSEDAVSETFLRAARHFDDFLEMYRRSPREIGPWAVVIVRNVALDMLEKENRSLPLAEDWDAPQRENVETVEGYQRLVELIRAMPQGYRRALELKYVLEQTTREIARELGLSEAAAEKRIERGRALLIQKLREEGYRYD